MIFYCGVRPYVTSSRILGSLAALEQLRPHIENCARHPPSQSCSHRRSPREPLHCCRSHHRNRRLHSRCDGRRYRDRLSRLWRPEGLADRVRQPAPGVQHCLAPRQVRLLRVAPGAQLLLAVRADRDRLWDRAAPPAPAAQLRLAVRADRDRLWDRAAPPAPALPLALTRPAALAALAVPPAPSRSSPVRAIQRRTMATDNDAWSTSGAPPDKRRPRTANGQACAAGKLARPSPTIGTALAAGYAQLMVYCERCRLRLTQ
jgi:hypothetical protein